MATGQGRQLPLTALAFAISAFTLAGIPPLGGFLSEWMIFSGGFASGQYLLSTIAVLQSVITITYYLLPMARLFLNKAPPIELQKSSILMMLPMLLLTGLNLILPFFFCSSFLLASILVVPFFCFFVMRPLTTRCLTSFLVSDSSMSFSWETF